jgi:ribosomal-protein-alanine acetyltransferase
LSSAEKTTKLTVDIRPLKEADLPEVMRQERMIFPDPWPQSAFYEVFKTEEWGGLVAESGGQTLGYAVFLIAAAECHLANIAVHPDYRRKSVAKQLLFSILEIATNQECEQIILEVRVSNEEAIAFYRRFGFVDLYRRPRYYHSPQEDALVLVRNLRENAPENA